MQETRVFFWSLGWEDPLEKEMVTHSSILAWEIPWAEEPGRLQSVGSQRVGHAKLLDKHAFLVPCCCSVDQLCLTLYNSTDCSMPGLPVPHHLAEFAQVYVHCIGDAIQPSHPLTPSCPALNLFQYRGLFQWVVCSHQMTKILELQL